MELKIDKVTLDDPAFKSIDERVDQRVEKTQSELILLLEKKYQFPKYLNKTQAAKYLNVSYNTMVNKYIPQGLKMSIIDGVVRISKEECDRFMKEHQK
ncbi:MAG: NUMOD1 domain-containing DNA-binding protein [Enterococcus sp.]|nr:NUMOD1 domain-containing DNA-binding protein [Enterococcus sp.]